MVLKTIDALGANLLPCRITHHSGTAHLHHRRSPYTATILLYTGRIGSPKPPTVGATTAYDSPHLTVACHLQQGHKQIQTTTMIDSGVTGTGFFRSSFVATHGLITCRLPHQCQLNVIDGCPVTSGDITHIVSLALNIKGHYEEIEVFLIELGDQNLILDIPWLRYHDVLLNFWEHTLSFPSPRYSWHNTKDIVPAPAPPPSPPPPHPMPPPPPTRHQNPPCPHSSIFSATIFQR